MKHLFQFLIIIIFSFIGEFLHHFIPLPIPACIYGIVIMFLCLELHIVPLSAVKETGDFLVKIMPIMFVPAAVGLLSVWDSIADKWFEYLVICLVTTLIVMFISGKVTDWVLKK